MVEFCVLERNNELFIHFVTFYFRKIFTLICRYFLTLRDKKIYRHFVNCTIFTSKCFKMTMISLNFYINTNNGFYVFLKIFYTK